MKKYFIKSAIVVFMVLFNSSCFMQKTQFKKMKTVENVDIQRYMGVWYEIARFPHRFEKDLVGVTATYTLNENGKISVLNSGYKYSLDGEFKTAKGRARMPNIKEPGRLQVAFFLWFWADYLILELDPDYKWVLVGSNSPDYLWILSREPKMSEDAYQMLVKRAAELGYNISKIERVEQKVK